MNRQRSIGPVGTLARIIVGAGLIALALWNPEPWNGRGFEWYDPVLGFIAFPAVVLTAQWLRTRFASEVLEATQPMAYCLNIAVGALLFAVEYTRDASALFYGTGMLLAAVRGYAGCEVLSISNWLLRRDDQVGCLLFSPLDEIEARIAGKRTAYGGERGGTRA